MSELAGRARREASAVHGMRFADEMRGSEGERCVVTDLRTGIRHSGVVVAQVHALYSLTNAELRDVIATERENGRAWGTLAEAARTLLQLRTGSPS